ncbi:hypothetical protein F511_40227 [Dorcoceras hygrometricum]|uniref:Uncharacterized protein n=1 Tax=Dorcoceras hygrometricum TaxID=472368 RepID=A0A2Z7ANX8_9LAMI|nr:hypothetical protein F511_40227 [Dorcoceras hygrometricum]
MLDLVPCWRLGAWLRPISRGNWHFNGWRLSFSKSGPRLESRLLRQSALENVTNISRTESPRRGGRNKSNHDYRQHTATEAHDGRRVRGGGYSLGFCESCCVDNVAIGIQLAVGPQQLRLRNHNFGLTHRIMVKRLATSPHDPLGITDSACKNQSVMVSVQYGPFNTYIPIRSTTIDSIGYPRTKASGESSTTKHPLLHASGPHPIPPPDDPN